MRVLLTWSDRAPRRPRGEGVHDEGPILRLLGVGEARYDLAIILCPRSARAGTRALAAEAEAFVDRAEVWAVDLPDPTDHAAIFSILQGILPDVPAEAEVDVLLSAGTPQAQTLWVILVQAGLLKARMLQVVPARFVPDLHPAPVREVRLDIEGFPEIRALREEVVRLRARIAAVGEDFVGDSPPMRQLTERVARVAAARVPVVILGETGTGKELVARAIHRQSERAAGPFVAENCGAFAEGVLQSELFGHEAGAFTGATGRRRGLFEQAHGGTLFLDELGELPLSVQVRLLRVLQAGTLRRVGGEEPVAVDVRVIGATHRDLRAMVAAGTFREDLWYRLAGAVIEVPPLRARGADLEHLVRHLLQQAGRPDLGLSRRAWEALRAWRWPGNVRELQAEVRRWVVFADGVVTFDDLSPELRAVAPPLLAEAPAPSVPATTSLAEVVAAAEAAAIRAAFSAEGGNRSATARRLGVDRNTLKRKLALYAIG